MLLEREAIGEVINVLREAGAQAFNLEKHQQLYEVLVKLFLEGQPLDEKLLRPSCRSAACGRSSASTISWAAWSGGVPSALHAARYASIVYDKYLLRQLVAAAHRARAERAGSRGISA